MVEAQSLAAAPKPLSVSPTKSLAVKTWDEPDKKNLAKVIGRVFDLQKQYGKNFEQIENIVAGFLWALAPYDPQKVIDAFAVYILNHADMPTPFDIRNIIDPVKKPWEPDKSYYITLKNLVKEGGPYALTTDEAAYVKKYEEHIKQASKED